jgi:DNA invertase Pin-like site-specific DNA recombinase
MQLTLPIFPSGSILISDCLGAFSHDKIVQYIVNGLPVYQHAAEDMGSFRFAISNFITLGLCKKTEVMQAFHVSESFVQRACKKAKTEGATGFFNKDSRKGSKHVIVESVRQQLQELLDKGVSVNGMAKQFGLNESTIRYHIKQGYLKKKQRENL